MFSNSSAADLLYVGKGKNPFKEHPLSYCLSCLISDDSLDNDIALIKVSPGISFSEHVQPACLPEPTAAYQPGQKCHVSGWGRTENGMFFNPFPYKDFGGLCCNWLL